MKKETAKMTLWTSRNTDRKGMAPLEAVADASVQKQIQSAFSQKVDDDRIKMYSPCADETSLARIFG